MNILNLNDTDNVNTLLKLFSLNVNKDLENEFLPFKSENDLKVYLISSLCDFLNVSEFHHLSNI